MLFVLKPQDSKDERKEVQGFHERLSVSKPWITCMGSKMEAGFFLPNNGFLRLPLKDLPLLQSKASTLATVFLI